MTARALPRACLATALALAGACGGEEGPVTPWEPSAVEAALPDVSAAVAAGDSQRALQLLDARAVRGELPDGSLHLRAMVLADLGRLAEATSAWERQLREHPGDGRGHALLAQLLLDAGRLDEATPHLQRALALAGRDPVVLFVAGRAAFLRDDDEEATRRFRDYLVADPYSRQAAEAHTALAQIAARAGPQAQQEAGQHQAVAARLTQLHDFLSSYQRRLADDPRDAEAAYGVATAYLNLYVSMGRDSRLRDTAERALQHVLSLRLDDHRALYNLGFIRTEQQRWAEARELFERSLSVQPDYAPARQNLGMLLVKLGETEAGRAHFERIIASEAGKEDVARARLQLAELYEHGSDPGDAARAIEQYRALLELYPDDELGVRPSLEKLQQLQGAAAPEATGLDRNP
jgi:tetratricopeptide (TPR) repeat protein